MTWFVEGALTLSIARAHHYANPPFPAPHCACVCECVCVFWSERDVCVCVCVFAYILEELFSQRRILNQFRLTVAPKYSQI